MGKRELVALLSLSSWCLVIVLGTSSRCHTSFVDLFFCLVFAMPLCSSVYVCLVVACWERADLLALVCGVQL